jgi:hypothetical protein
LHGLQHLLPILSRRRDVAADLTETLGSLLRAKTPRDLLFQFHHTDVSLRLVVIKWYVHIVHKGQHFPLMGLQAVQQVLGWALFDAPSLFGVLSCDGTGSVEWEWFPILKQSLIQTPVQFSSDLYVVEIPGRMGICRPYVVYPINSSRVFGA